MKHPFILLIVALCVFVSQPPVHAHSRTQAVACASELDVDGETITRVLGLAAPEFGLTDGQIAALYGAGQVLIDDLGPIRGGHRYGVTYDADFIIIEDVIHGG